MSGLVGAQGSWRGGRCALAGGLHRRRVQRSPAHLELLHAHHVHLGARAPDVG